MGVASDRDGAPAGARDRARDRDCDGAIAHTSARDGARACIALEMEMECTQVPEMMERRPEMESEHIWESEWGFP
jgi:hypothetical protein